MLKRALFAVAAVLLIVGGIVGAVHALAPTASCTSSPAVTDTGSGQRITVTCTLPKPPPTTVRATVTATATATVTATTTATVTATPTAQPTPTPTPTPSPTALPSPDPSGCTKPNASNTGATGTLTAYTGPMTITTPGTVIENKTVNGDLIIDAANVTVRNTRVTGGVGVRTTTGARIERVTAQSAGISSSQDVVITRSNLGFTSNGDAMHVSSDAGSMVANVEISHNYVHDPRPAEGAHYDGLQVRGIRGLTIYCNNFDLGAFRWEFNAPVFLEHANGAHAGVVVDRNWLIGGAFGFMYAPDANTLDESDGTRLTGNHFGGDYKWAPCLAEGGPPPVQAGNDLSGEPFTPCG